MSYPNLAAEMAREDLTIQKLSETTGIPYSTLAPKIRGENPIKFSEAIMIRDAINHKLPLEYLFDDAAMVNV